MKMDIQKKDVDSYTTKYVLTEAFNCIHAHVQKDRKTDRNICVKYAYRLINLYAHLQTGQVHFNSLPVFLEKH